MESFGIVIFDYVNDEEISHFKSVLRKAEDKVAKIGAFEDDRYRLNIEEEFGENGQYFMRYMGGILTSNIIKCLFEMLAEQNFQFARANDYPDEDPSLNLFFIDNGTFSFIPLWDTYINMDEEAMVENGEFFQKELDVKGVAFFNEIYDKWLVGLRIDPEHKLIQGNVTSLKDGLIELYNFQKKRQIEHKKASVKKISAKKWWKFW
ncbi:hypothetical protein WNY77_20850 [Paraglaciecola mesophila]|uniref:Uncharacterized protein n=1 Tax=Paraglaciecola mesophila TaxID=197222 RepID=A0ABU9T165_9ALTE